MVISFYPIFQSTVHKLIPLSQCQVFYKFSFKMDI